MSVSHTCYPKGTTPETATEVFFLRAEMDETAEKPTIRHASKIFFRCFAEQVCDIAACEAAVNAEFETHARPRVLKFKTREEVEAEEKRQQEMREMTPSQLGEIFQTLASETADLSSFEEAIQTEFQKIKTFHSRSAFPKTVLVEGDEIDPVALMTEQYETSQPLSITLYFDSKNQYVPKPPPLPTHEEARQMMIDEKVEEAVQALAQEAETPTEDQIQEATQKATDEVTEEQVIELMKELTAEYAVVQDQYQKFIKSPAHAVVITYTFSGDTLRYAAAIFHAESHEERMLKRVESRGGFSKLPIGTITSNREDFLKFLVSMSNMISPTKESEEIFSAKKVRPTALARFETAPITVTLEGVPEDPEERNSFFVNHLIGHFQEAFEEQNYEGLTKGSKSLHAKVLAQAQEFLDSQISSAELIDPESDDDLIEEPSSAPVSAHQVAVEIPATPRASLSASPATPVASA